MKKTFFAFLFAVLLAGALCFAAACAKIPDATDPPDGTDPPAGESPGPIPGVDCHIKLGDTAYDFTAGMPDGVTADTSAVNFQAAGAYTILYKRDGSDNLEKKAYVYGMPAFSFEREAIGSNVYPLTYFEARHIDWGGVSALGVSAADSFGTSLDVAAQVLDAYDGDYGSYRVRYEATDAAGNVAESVAAYAVAGTNQPTVADASFDLSGAAAQIPVAWGGAAEALLYYGGTLVDGGLYGEGQGGITIPAATFNALDPDGDSYDFRIETDLWYEEFTVSVTDAAAPLFEVPPGGYIFAPVPSLALPLARKTSEQRFTLSYAAGGGLSVSAGANGLTLTKTGGGAIPAGDYTVTVKAMRGSSQDGTGTVSFTVYAAEAFGRAVAPLVNNQYAGVIGQYNSNYGGFAFDAAAGAYRYVKNASPYTEYDPAKIICAASSVPGGKLLADHTEYSAFVFDIYYDDLNTDGKDLIFLFGKAGFMRDGSVAQITETATSASVAYADIAQDVWYTVSVPMTGSFTAYNGFISLFSAFGNAAYNFLVRNMRFQAERIGGGYIYQTDVNKLYELPALGQENPICSVMRDGDNEVTLTDGNKLKLSAAGEYTAAIGTETISFTVYTEDAFGAAVAPLTNGQYEGAFYQFDPSYGGFIFDAAAGAYRYVRKADSYTVTFPPAIVCKTASVPGGKLLANNGGYTAFVFDIYYNALNASGKDLIFFGGAKYMQSAAQITDAATSASVEYSAIQQGVWYTVSFPITANFADSGGSIYLFSAFGNDAYDFLVRNMRFGCEGLNDGYIYQIDENKLYELPALGQVNPTCAVTRGGEGVTLTDGNKLKLSAAGEYTAAIGTETIHFTVYTEADFNKTVAPLTNGQYAGAFSQFDSSYGGFVFDAAAGAYRYIRSAVNYTVTFPPAIVCKTASVPGGKLLANNGGYTAFVFDIYYNTLNASGKDLIFFGGAKYMNATATITDASTSASVEYGAIQQGVWYTVSFPITANLADSNGNIYLFSAFGNDAYDFLVRNMRFGA